MAHRNGMTRRTLIQSAAAGAAGAVLAGSTGSAHAAEACCPAGGSCADVKTHTNDEFYTDGTFDQKKAKQAYFDMMERFGYPVVDKLRTDEFWVLDFACGDFVNAGMGGIFWWNDKKYGYFGHEIYLLPGQMIVEHAHVKTDQPPKMEAWQVRHGMIYTFGEGEETKPCPVKLPESQKKHITVKHVVPLKPGEIAGLNRPEARHFMYAGPEGAIVTEYATYHDGAGLRFTNPKVKL